MGTILPFRQPEPPAPSIDRLSVTYLAALVHEEKARHDYLGARAQRELLDGICTREEMYEDSNAAFDSWRDLAVRMTMTPSLNHDELTLKRVRLGVWLTAEGDFYDRLRAGVARDAEALGPHPDKRRRPRK